MLQVRAQTAIGQYIHVSAEQLLNVLLEGDDIEQRSASLNVDEEIDVAVFMIITARDRAEHTYVANAVARRTVQDFAAETPEQFKPHASMIAVLVRAAVPEEQSAGVMFGGGGMRTDNDHRREILA
jgi:hypothetical protein